MVASSTGSWVKFLALIVALWFIVAGLGLGWLGPQVGIEGSVARIVVFALLGVVTAILYNRMVRGGGNAR